MTSINNYYDFFIKSMILPDELNYSVPNFECTHSKVGENKNFSSYGT